MKSKKTPRAKTGKDDGRPEGENVVDLMDALKKSVKGTKGTKGKSGGSRRKAS